MGELKLDVEDIQQIIRSFADSDMTDLEVAVGGTRVRLARGQAAAFGAPRGNAPAPAKPMAGPTPASSATTSADPDDWIDAAAVSPVDVERSTEPEDGPTDGSRPVDRTGLEAIVSPMVGVFYRRPAPEDPPYVQPGVHVEPDTAICTIEVMKMFNEIKAGLTGRVVEILVGDEQLVHPGETLMLVEPA